MNAAIPARRTWLLALVGTLVLGVLALIIVTLAAVWRLTAWGSDALATVTDATVSAVAPLREDAQRVLQHTKDTLAAETVAVVAATQQESVRVVNDAQATVAAARQRASDALAEPHAALERVADTAAQDASGALLAAAAALSAKATERSHAAIGSAGTQDPADWLRALGLEQTHGRQIGEVTESSYSAAAPEFSLDTLREQLVKAGYREHVVALSDGALNADYRAERHLRVSATTVDGIWRIEVREMPLAPGENAAP